MSPTILEKKAEYAEGSVRPCQPVTHYYTFAKTKRH
jgi:hypothetical protein